MAYDNYLSMKGFVIIAPEEIDLDEDLDHWLGLALEFNPRAKSSKKKKTSNERNDEGGQAN